MNPQKLSPQGYNINNDPMNENPFWDREGTGGNVPAGGLTGQVLTKKTDADYDTEWTTPESGGSGLPAGGNPGDLLKKTATGAEWTEPDFPTDADVEAAVSTERTRATAAENQLSGRISTLNQQFETYVDSNNSVVGAIGDDLVSEISARTAADTALGGRIDSEATARAAADNDLADWVTGLAGDLNSLDQSTSAAITQLNTDLDTVEASVTTEANARIDADAILRQDLTQAIQTEAAQRQSEDAAIRASIGALSGLPAGGTTGQVLTKASNTDFDVDWETVPGGGSSLPSGGSTGQALVKASGADGDVTWGNVPTVLQVNQLGNRVTALETIGKEYVFPSASGTAGQVLALQLTGGKQLVWANAATSTAIDALDARVDDLEADMARAEGNITGLISSVNTNAQNIAANSRDISAAQSDISLIEDDIDDLQAADTALSARITAIRNAFTPVALAFSSGVKTGVTAIPWITVDPDGTIHGGTQQSDIPSGWLNNKGFDRLIWRTWNPNGTVVLHTSSIDIYVPVNTFLNPSREVTFAIPSGRADTSTPKRISVKLVASIGQSQAVGTVDFELHAGGEFVCKSGRFKYIDANGNEFEKANGMDDFIAQARWISAGNLIGVNYAVMNDFFVWLYDLANAGAAIPSTYGWDIEPTVTMTFGLPSA